MSRYAQLRVHSWNYIHYHRADYHNYAAVYENSGKLTDRDFHFNHKSAMT